MLSFGPLPYLDRYEYSTNEWAYRFRLSGPAVRPPLVEWEYDRTYAHEGKVFRTRVTDIQFNHPTKIPTAEFLVIVPKSAVK